MDSTYKILAADGKEYGPATFLQLQEWIREGRVTAVTQLLRNDMSAWQPASTFAELSFPTAAQPAPAPTTPAGSTAPASPDLVEVEKRVHSGGSWFYWVAGLSLVNSIAAFAGGGGGFVIGLAVTQFIDAFVAESAGGARLFGLVLGVLAAGMFALFGVFACKRHSWAFIVGMVLYGFDTLLTVLAQHWLGLAFHAWVLVSLFLGLRAAMQVNAMNRAD